MACTPNVYSPPPRPRMDASAAPAWGFREYAKGTPALLPPDILTYRYGSRMICVATGKNYEVTFLPAF